EDFRQAAVQQVIEGGRSIPQVARSLEVPKGTLGNWVTRARKGEPITKRSPVKPVTELEAELTRLRAENSRLKLEKEILKRAAAHDAGGQRGAGPGVESQENRPADARARAGQPQAPAVPGGDDGFSARSSDRAQRAGARFRGDGAESEMAGRPDLRAHGRGVAVPGAGDRSVRPQDRRLGDPRQHAAGADDRGTARRLGLVRPRCRAGASLRPW